MAAAVVEWQPVQEPTADQLKRMMAICKKNGHLLNNQRILEEFAWFVSAQEHGAYESCTSSS